MTFRRRNDRRPSSMPSTRTISIWPYESSRRIPLQIESVDGIPPPLHDCIYDDKPEWLEWLLDHGADIERREQDYGSTPLTAAVVHRQKRIIRTLVKRGADATRAMDCAQRGLAGAFEDDPRLDREGYREIVELLRELGIGSRQ